MSVSPAAGKPGGTPQAAQAAFLTEEQLAQRWNVSRRHVRRLVDAGKCPPPFRLGRCRRFPLAVIEKWEADGCPRVRTVRAGGVA